MIYPIPRWPFAENDRAQAERRTDGFIKVIADKKGRMHERIVGAHAGELIFPRLPWRTNEGRCLRGCDCALPDDQRSLETRDGHVYTPSLFSDRTKKIVRFLMKF